jgi:hypothetical protein
MHLSYTGTEKLFCVMDPQKIIFLAFKLKKWRSFKKETPPKKNINFAKCSEKKKWSRTQTWPGPRNFH